MKPALRVTLLGTGPSQGVPAVGGLDGRGNWGECDPNEPRNRRGRTSALIEGADGSRLLVDCGPDCRAQLLAAETAHLDAVLITHAHADHLAGIDELRSVNRATQRPLPVWASAETLDELQSRFGYAFRPPTKGFYRPALEPNMVAPGERIAVGTMLIEMLELDHFVMRPLGLRIGRFAYTTDVLRFPQESFARLHGLDTWVVSCMTPGLNPAHAGLDQVLAWCRELRPRRTVLTHLGDRMDYAGISARLPKGVELGFDGQHLEVEA